MNELSLMEVDSSRPEDQQQILQGMFMATEG
jgi:hypothetical protein